MARAAARPAPAAEPPPATEPPVRYRAMAFQRPIGKWRPRRVLALQDAIDAGMASREWDSGVVYRGPGVQIAQDRGEEPMTPALKRQAQALAFHRRHGAAALVRASTKVAAATAPDEAQLWSEIVEELKTIKAEALRAERGRR